MRRRRFLTLAPPLALMAACPLMAGCGKGDLLTIARAAATRDPAAAAQAVARSKATSYALNPKSLAWDLKKFQKALDAFRKAVAGSWGEAETREPAPREYVKYLDGYKSRALVDFDKGVLTVETVDQNDPKNSLRQAVATALLTPGDPRAVDLYSAGPVKLGQTPFLLGEVKDHDGQDIRWQWRADRFAAHVVKTDSRTRTAHAPDGPRTITHVSIPMVRDHLKLRAKKYLPLAKKFAARFKLETSLAMAVIKTESDFNPFAVSRAPAFGLMQIVPRSAGAEVTRFLTGKKGRPDKDFLFNPENNILYGTAYLHILFTRHLKDIADPLAREYCVISAYNTGAGNVLKTFHKDRAQAKAAINSMAPKQVYDTLRQNLPYQETRRYLAKVVTGKKDFVGI